MLKLINSLSLECFLSFPAKLSAVREGREGGILTIEILNNNIGSETPTHLMLIYNTTLENYVKRETRTVFTLCWIYLSALKVRCLKNVQPLKYKHDFTFKSLSIANSSGHQFPLDTLYLFIAV